MDIYAETPQARIKRLEKRVLLLEEDLRDYEALFALQAKAVMEANRIWQEETGNDYYADLHELITWLLERKQKS